jgi:hypothetical protein
VRNRLPMDDLSSDMIDAIMRAGNGIPTMIVDEDGKAMAILVSPTAVPVELDVVSRQRLERARRPEAESGVGESIQDTTERVLREALTGRAAADGKAEALDVLDTFSRSLGDATGEAATAQRTLTLAAGLVKGGSRRLRAVQEITRWLGSDPSAPADDPMDRTVASVVDEIHARFPDIPRTEVEEVILDRLARHGTATGDKIPAGLAPVVILEAIQALRD